MKRISIRQMALVNFKGVRSLKIDFDGEVTSISGRNGSGKTTLFDAFTWVLFGKDSRDRKSFDIKTLGDDGAAIPRLPHEVTVTLDIDGEQITLTRRYNEKWVKRRGSAVEEFTGHEEERLYNDVPCSLKEWNEKIAAICPEEVFKMITSPACFVSQKADAQRSMLLKMVGGFTDNDVVAASGQRQDFIELLGTLCGKSLEEYKREIGAKKKRIKAELDALPERIDERLRDNEAYAATDYPQIEKELQEKETALAQIEQQLTQASARVNESLKAKESVHRQLTGTRERMMQIAAETRTRMSEQYYETENRRAGLQRNLEKIETYITLEQQNIAATKADIEKKTAQRASLIAEWKSINAQALEFSLNDFICPTCGQNLDPGNIEKKKAEMAANFNARKAEELRANKERGQQCSKAVLDTLESKLTSLAANIAKAETDADNIKAALGNLPQTAKPTDEDILPALRQSDEYTALEREAERLAAELDRPAAAATDTAELDEAKTMLADSVAELRVALDGRKYQQRNNARIAELEQQLHHQAEALAKLEGIEFTIADFSKARIEAVESKINALFALVRFKMYETQINGGEVETCEATVGGVPYSSLNNAMRINAGLDIINAICKYQGISAPIFIDNAESVLEPLPTTGQQVQLIVRDQDLTIE